METVAYMLFLFSSLFTSKFSSLPQLYHHINNKRGIPVQHLRRIEKAGLKVRKLSVDVKYLESCLELKLCPKVLRVKDPKLSGSCNAHRYDMACLKERLQDVKNELTETNGLYCVESKKLFSNLSLTEGMCLRKLQASYFKNELEKINGRHKKKLFNLWKMSGKQSPDCIVNISDVELSAHEMNALQFGLKHHILPSSFEGNQVKMNIERTLNEVTWKSKTAMDYTTKEDIRQVYYQYENSCKNLFSCRKNAALHRTLKSLAKNDKICICSFDKGVGVVVMNSTDYYSKLDEIVNDPSKFEKVHIPLNKDHPTISKEKSIKRYIKNHVKDVDDKNLAKLIPCGSSPGKLYGLCKVHKKNYPLRPVISMINTPEYMLAKYLDSFIKPNIPTRFMLNSTHEFIDKISTFSLSGNENMVSFDVTSLFTNVPLIHTVDIIIDRIYSSNAVITPNIPEKIFRKMLLLCTQGMFLYKDVLYRQTDGVAMGSPLGPTIANMFLAHMECEELFNDTMINKPAFYPKLFLRYIDDCFALFASKSEALQFLNVLNCLHPNLNFTIEVGSNSLPFLDVCVDIVDNNFVTKVYRKSTHTGVFLNFHAVAPRQWKRGLILCLINRAKSICSSSALFYEEISNLRKMFIDNCYTVRYFDYVVSKVTNPKLQTNESVDEEDSFSILRIPFYGPHSVKFAKRVSKIISQKFNINIRIVYSTFKVSNYFMLKCRTPLPLLSKCVYKFNCVLDTHTSYIGYTKRHLTTRVNEHTVPSLAKSSHVYKHIVDCGACSAAHIDVNNFRVLKQCRNETDCKLAEAFAIKRWKPSINKQMFAKGSSLLLNVWN